MTYIYRVFYKKKSKEIQKIQKKSNQKKSRVRNFKYMDFKGKLVSY